MASGVKNFLSENLTGILITLGLGAVGGVVLHDKWEEEQARNQLLDKVAAADVTNLVCTSGKTQPDLTLTLAPLLEMEDRMTHNTGENLLRHVTKLGISFAFCPLAQGTTSFEVVPDATGRQLSVLKISDAATAQAQQAAVLQFMKEFEASSVSIHYNAVVQADSGLTKVMPGRMAVGTPVKNHDFSQYGLTLRVPSR